MKNHNPPKEKKKGRLKNWAVFSGVAFEMFAVIGLMSWAGVWLDEHYNFEFPLFTLILSLSGVGISMYAVIRAANNMNSKDDDSE